MLEKRIAELKELVNKYDISTLNTLYKNSEISFVEQTLLKQACAPKLAKKMLSQAQKSNISASKQTFINSIIQKSQNFDFDFFTELFKHKFSLILKKGIENCKKNKEIIGDIIIYFDYEPKEIDILFFSCNNTELESAVFFQTTKLNFTNVWVNRNKLEFLDNLFTEVDYYTNILGDLFLLYSFKIVKNLIELDENQILFQNQIFAPNLVIKMVEHDNFEYILLEK